MAGIVGWARSLRGSWEGKVDVLLVDVSSSSDQMTSTAERG